MSIGLEMVFITVFALVVAVPNIADMTRRNSHDIARWAMSCIILLGALGFLVQIPSVYRGVDEALEVPNVAVVVHDAAFLSCAAAAHIWISMWPGVTPGTISRDRVIQWVATMTTAGIVAVVIAFATGRHPVECPSRFDEVYVHDGMTAVMIFGYLALFAGMFWWAAVRVRRGRKSVAAVGVPWLVTGLGLIEAGMTLAVVYAASLGFVPVLSMFGGSHTNWPVVLSYSLGVGSAAFSCTGFSCRVWGPRWEAFSENRRENYLARRQCRQLEPLYRLVVGEESGGFGIRRGLGLRYRDPSSALAHQVCAIIEASDRLAGYHDASVDATATQWGEALAEAIRLGAAVRVRHAGGPIPSVGGRARQVDWREEVAHHLRVASALSLVHMLQRSGAPEMFSADASASSTE